MAAETLVDLLRHGEAAGGAVLRGTRCDPPLSARGWAQLQAATAANPGWEAVIASPLARCRAFAESLAAGLGCRAQIDERLREYDFGTWDGRPLDQLWREHGDALAAFLGDPDSRTPPGGETAADFRARVRAAWDALLAHHGGRHVLLIGHGGVLRQLLADVLQAGTGAHGALEWPHAAMSRVRVIEDPPQPRAQSLVWHARTTAAGAGHGR